MSDETELAVKQYLNSLKGVLAPHFGPGGMYNGRDGALRLAREIGYGLRGFDRDEAEKAVQGTYSDMLVRFTMGARGGVPVDAKEWFDEMRRAMGEPDPDPTAYAVEGS